MCLIPRRNGWCRGQSDVCARPMCGVWPFWNRRQGRRWGSGREQCGKTVHIWGLGVRRTARCVRICPISPAHWPADGRCRPLRNAVNRPRRSPPLICRKCTTLRSGFLPDFHRRAAVLRSRLPRQAFRFSFACVHAGFLAMPRRQP
jgi:hypothetical protein